MLVIHLTQEQAAKVYGMAEFDTFMADGDHDYILRVATAVDLWHGDEETEVDPENFHGIQGSAAIFTQDNRNRVVWMRFELAFLERVPKKSNKKDTPEK